VSVHQLDADEVRPWRQARVVEKDAPAGRGLQLELPPVWRTPLHALLKNHYVRICRAGSETVIAMTYLALNGSLIYEGFQFYTLRSLIRGSIIETNLIISTA
jgi:hypothetical protein